MPVSGHPCPGNRLAAEEAAREWERDNPEEFRPSKFKLWYVHQVPGPAYEQEVDSPELGQQILDAIFQVALYQFNNKMIPDYANMGGIVYWDEPEGEWFDYHPEEWA